MNLVRILLFNWLKSYFKRKCFALLLIILAAFVLNNLWLQSSTGKPTTVIINKTHIVIISTTFYATSTIYSANTFAMLINTRDPEHDKIYPLIRRPLECVSKNKTHTKNTTLDIKPAYPSVILCKWSSFYALCESVERPTQLLIRAAAVPLMRKNGPKIFGWNKGPFVQRTQKRKFNNVEAMIPFSPAFQPARKLDVINCYSPLYFYERWQTSVTAFEIYRHFGSQLQIIYVESAQTDIFKLLRIYEEVGIIRIEPWTDLKIVFGSKDQIDYDINAELEWRNQPASHLDCFFKYREAANWIIVGDVDDILLPKVGHTYIDEFKFLSFHYHDAAAFRYARFNTKLSTSINSQNYSLFRMLTDVKVSLERETGKAVLNTARVKTTWMHWLGEPVDGGRLVDLEVPVNVIFHFRNYTFMEELKKFNKFYAEKKIRWAPYKFEFWLNQRDAKAIDERFKQVWSFKQSRTELFKTLPNTTHYFDIIDKCYDRILYSRVGRGPLACPGPQRCPLPKRLPNLRCTVADRMFTGTALNEESTVYVSRRGYNFYEKEDGCIL